jgi:threonine dehydrogenase-like Zn-dependent dehydrogenase
VKALRFDGEIAVRDVPEPELEPGEASIRVRLAGICSTDLQVVRGYLGFRGTLGHEAVGEVERCDSDPSLVGARVVGEINVACGVCPRCRRGQRQHCALRSVMGLRDRDGCFATRVVLPVENLHRVPDDICDERAAFTEPLAAAFEVLEQVAVDPGTPALVLGDGKLGLLVAMVLASAGLETWVVGRHDRKLAIAQTAGARVCCPEALGQSDFALVVEATGSPEGLAYAMQRVRPRGTVVLKSTFVERPSVDTSRIVVDEIAVVGSRCGPFDRALRALEDGSIDPRPLIEARYPLSEGVTALEHAGRSGVLKVMLDCRAV